MWLGATLRDAALALSADGRIDLLDEAGGRTLRFVQALLENADNPARTVTPYLWAPALESACGHNEQPDRAQ